MSRDVKVYGSRIILVISSGPFRRGCFPESYMTIADLRRENVCPGFQGVFFILYLSLNRDRPKGQYGEDRWAISIPKFSLAGQTKEECPHIRIGPGTIPSDQKFLFDARLGKIIQKNHYGCRYVTWLITKKQKTWTHTVTTYPFNFTSRCLKNAG